MKKEKVLIIYPKRDTIEEIENILSKKGLALNYFIEETEDDVKIKIYGEESTLYNLLHKFGEDVKKELKDTIELWNKPERLLPYEFIDGVIINPDPKNIIINLVPGLAFGTGRHESTKIAAKLLMTLEVHNKSVLDIGCGSGILSILSKKLGADYVLSIDNEQQAIDKTRETAALNNENINVKRSDLLEDISERFDIIIANILPPILKRLLLKLNKVTLPKSHVIFSGIYEDSLQSMREEIIRYGYSILKEEELNKWYGFLFTPTNV